MSPINRGTGARPAAAQPAANRAPLPSKTQPQAQRQAQAAASAVSFDPASFTSGGLIDDVDVVVHDAQFVLWDYMGTVAQESPALGLALRIINPDGTIDETDHDQYYSCGQAEDFVPGDNGSGEGSILVPVGSKTGVNNNTNAAVLIASWINCGVPVDLLAPGDCKQWIGIRTHMNRVPQPKRNNQDPGAKAKDILVATKLLGLPGETATAPTRANGAAKGMSKVQSRPSAPVVSQTATTAASPTDIDPAVDEAATNAVVEILAAGPVTRKQIGPKVFAALKGNPLQAAAMKWAFSEEFLNQGVEAGLWAYDGATVTGLAG